jgi:hypothetical protein
MCPNILFFTQKSGQVYSPAPLPQPTRTILQSGRIQAYRFQDAPQTPVAWPHAETPKARPSPAPTTSLGTPATLTATTRHIPNTPCPASCSIADAASHCAISRGPQRLWLASPGPSSRANNSQAPRYAPHGRKPSRCLRRRQVLRRGKDSPPEMGFPIQQGHKRCHSSQRRPTHRRRSRRHVLYKQQWHIAAIQPSGQCSAASPTPNAENFSCQDCGAPSLGHSGL